MTNRDYFKYKILAHLNLVLVYPVCLTGNLAGLMQAMNDAIIKDCGYKDGMNAIMQYQDSFMPEVETYYNDLDRKVSLTVRVNCLVDIFRPDKKQITDFAKIFKLFSVRNKDFAQQTLYAYSVKEAVELLKLQENAEEIEEFFSIKPFGDIIL